MAKFNEKVMKNLLKYKKEQPEIVGTFSIKPYNDISEYFSVKSEVIRLLELTDETLESIDTNKAKQIALFIDTSNQKEKIFNIEFGGDEIPDELKSILEKMISEKFEKSTNNEIVRVVILQKEDLTDLFKLMVEFLIKQEEYELLSIVKQLTIKYPNYFDNEIIFKW